MVGDDAQSIYSFRAATVRNILDFPGQFSPPAAIVTLDRNYRSTQPILAAANAVIELASERFTKNLWTDRVSAERPRLVAVRDETDQARYVVEQVLANREAGMSLKQQAVLFRTSHHSGPLEVELTRRNIPFVKFGGLKFLDASHVKDLLALLRFVQNPRDRVAGFRADAAPARRRPDLGAAGARSHARRRRSDRRADGLAGPAAGWGRVARLRRCDRAASRRQQPDGRPNSSCARRWYEPHLERIHEDAATRKADLIQLEQIAAGYPSRERFLTELTLDPPDATSDQAGVPLLDEDYLILSTIHSAKGQEWKSVFVLNVVDGCIPSDLGTGTTARDRGGAAAALCGDDPGQGPPASHRAAALLHAPAIRHRRPPRLCGPHPLHSERAPEAVRARVMAGRYGGADRRRRRHKESSGRRRREHAAYVAVAAADPSSLGESHLVKAEARFPLGRSGVRFVS